MRKNRELEVNVWCFGGSCTAPGQTHSSATHECNSLFILIFSRQHLTSFHFPACSGRDVWSRRSAHTWTVTRRVDSLDACKKIKNKKKNGQWEVWRPFQVYRSRSATFTGCHTTPCWSEMILQLQGSYNFVWLCRLLICPAESRFLQTE